MNKKNFLVFSVVAVVFAGLGAFLGHRQTSSAPAEPNAVASLLSQSFTDVDGTSRSLAQWKGKPLVVNFWATWCAPCVEEMPELSALQTELNARNIQILGIGIDSLTNIADFARKYKITYPLYVGGMQGTALSRRLGNAAGGLPFTVLVDRDGKLRKTYLGRLKMDELKKDLAGL